MAHDDQKDIGAGLEDALGIDGHDASHHQSDGKRRDRRQKGDGPLCKPAAVTVRRNAQNNRDHHDFKDGNEQGPHIYRNPHAAQQPCEHRHERQCNNGCQRGERHGIRHVASGNKGQHIGGGAAGGRAHKNDAHRQIGRQGKQVAQRKSQQRHAAELGKQAQQQGVRLGKHHAEILEPQGHAHAKHDAPQKRRNMRGHPAEQLRLP